MELAAITLLLFCVADDFHINPFAMAEFNVMVVPLLNSIWVTAPCEPFSIGSLLLLERILEVTCEKLARSTAKPNGLF